MHLHKLVGFKHFNPLLDTLKLDNWKINAHLMLDEMIYEIEVIKYIIGS